jgi:hypothetical protein
MTDKITEYLALADGATDGPFDIERFIALQSASRTMGPELARLVLEVEGALIVGLKIRNDVHPNDAEPLYKALAAIQRLRGGHE